MTKLEQPVRPLADAYGFVRTLNNQSEILNVIGYDPIYLATGYQDCRLTEMHYLKGVMGKLPPWTN